MRPSPRTRARWWSRPSSGGHRSGPTPAQGAVTSRPEVIKQVVDGSLDRLGVAVIDLDYSTGSTPRCRSRTSPGRQGTHPGRQGAALRQVGGGRRDDPPSHAVQPVTAVRASTRCGGGVPRGGVLAACQALGIGFVPTAHSARASHRHHHRLDQLRRQQRHPQHHPPVRPGRPAAQPGVVDLLASIAQPKGPPRPDRPGLAAGPQALDRPDPGTRKLHRLEENIAAAAVELSAEERTEIQHAASKIQMQGGRYNQAAENMTNL